jgi:hypothetical protein
MNDAVSLNDRKGKAMVTVRGYRTNPALQSLADRIRKIQDPGAYQKNLHKTLVILISEVNRALKPVPATLDEIIAALESGVIVNCLVSKIREMRDPGYYDEAA